jgi:hypothetical protein
MADSKFKKRCQVSERPGRGAGNYRPQIQNSRTGEAGEPRYREPRDVLLFSSDRIRPHGLANLFKLVDANNPIRKDGAAIAG